MLNVVESGIKVLKSILATNAFGIETQHPLLNKTQWICLMETIVQFLNIRPIPSQKSGTIGVILNPNRLLKPYLQERDYFTLFENLTKGIFPDDKIFTTILEDNKKLATILSTELKKVLTNDGRLLFKPKEKEPHLKPEVDDIVIIVKEIPKLGLITEVKEDKIMCKVRLMQFGQNEDQILHCSKLALLYRPITKDLK